MCSSSTALEYFKIEEVKTVELEVLFVSSWASPLLAEANCTALVCLQCRVICLLTLELLVNLASQLIQLNAFSPTEMLSEFNP